MHLAILWFYLLRTEVFYWHHLNYPQPQTSINHLQIISDVHFHTMMWKISLSSCKFFICCINLLWEFKFLTSSWCILILKTLLFWIVAFESNCCRDIIFLYFSEFYQIDSRHEGVVSIGRLIQEYTMKWPRPYYI